MDIANIDCYILYSSDNYTITNVYLLYLIKLQYDNFKIILGYKQEGNESMKAIFIILTILGIMIILAGIGIIAWIISRIFKINLNSKYKRLIIIMCWCGLVFGAWFIMEGLNLSWNTISILIEYC